MMSKTTLSIAAAGAGLCFLGYCVYFDRKRRNDPNFKQKLRERRRKALESKQKSSNSSFGLSAEPSKEEMQRFFLQEIQKGEELLSTGDFEEGVEHLSNAVAVCGQPQQLLQVLQQTLPPQVFQLLIQKLPSVASTIRTAYFNSPMFPNQFQRLSGAAGGDSGGATISGVPETGILQDEVVD